MPVLRNPFRKTVLPHYVSTASSTNVVDPLDTMTGKSNRTAHGPDKVYPVVTLKVASAISILRKPDDENTYKLSVVNDSGIYLPPSPTESRGFWSRENSSSSFKNRPPVSPSDDQFTISRESFDSYRRSFDISARSPVRDTSASRPSTDVLSVKEVETTDVCSLRMSLDIPSQKSLDIGSTPQNSCDPRLPIQIPPTLKDVEEPENDVEDLKLNENSRPKKMGIFSRFGHDHPFKDAPRFKTNIFSRRDPHIDFEHASELKNIVLSESLVA